MKRHGSFIAAAGALTLCAAAPAVAQGVPATARSEAQQKQERYQIGQMERVLEGAVEHGATMMRDRLQAVVPPAQAQLLIQENAHVRGFRLEGYGVFFDVIVPSLDGSLTWSLRTLDQNDLGLQSALSVLKTRINPTDIDMQQALKRIELQVGPATATLASLTGQAPPQPDARNVTGSAAGLSDQLAGAAAANAAPPPACGHSRRPDPRRSERGVPRRGHPGAHRRHARPQQPARHRSERMGDVAARRNEDRPRLAPADSGAQSVVIRVQRRRPGGLPRRADFARRSPQARGPAGVLAACIWAGHSIKIRGCASGSAPVWRVFSSSRPHRVRAGRRSQEGPRRFWTSSTGWFDAGIVNGQNKLVPAISFKLKNVSDQKLKVIQVNVLFKRVNDPAEWGSGFVTVVGSSGPGSRRRRPRPLLVKSNLGYTGSDQTRQEMLQNSQFIDAKAEFSAKYGSIQWARLGEFPVTRTLISN